MSSSLHLLVIKVKALVGVFNDERVLHGHRGGGLQTLLFALIVSFVGGGARTSQSGAEFLCRGFAECGCVWRLLSHDRASVGGHSRNALSRRADDGLAPTERGVVAFID